MTKRYVDIKVISEYTSLSTKTLYEWAASGRIPSYKAGSRVLFDLRDIDQVMATLKRPCNKIVEDVNENSHNVPDNEQTGTIRPRERRDGNV